MVTGVAAGASGAGAGLLQAPSVVIVAAATAVRANERFMGLSVDGKCTNCCDAFKFHGASCKTVSRDDLVDRGAG